MFTYKLACACRYYLKNNASTDTLVPDELMGEAFRYVIAHEVGHTLGLRHNYKSTYYYDVEKYRDPEFTSKYGLEASIITDFIQMSLIVVIGIIILPLTWNAAGGFPARRLSYRNGKDTIGESC